MGPVDPKPPIYPIEVINAACRALEALWETVYQTPMAGKTILCSPENYSHFATFASGVSPEMRNEWIGLPVRVDPFVPTWKEYPRPKWWRRWFLREKQRPRERVAFVTEGRQWRSRD